jgi:glycosyltransferase involved in cell wall biosynthesis
MRVAIDTNPLYTTQAGMARYVRELVRAERSLGLDDFELTEIGWPVTNFQFRQPQRALKTAYRELFWSHFVAPRKIRQARAQVFHTTGVPFISVPSAIPHVATLHDLAVFQNPERFRRWHRWSAQRCFLRLRQVPQLICISQFTARQAIEILGVSPRRISVVYYGCPFPPEAGVPPEQKPGFAVPEDFFLFVSSLEPGKNARLIREAYQLADARQQPLPPLVLCGSRWQGVPHEGPPPANWLFAGHQTDPTLVYLYRRARALLFPSKYEGFGLPVIEALALGCPVICSPVASLPEVGGGAALYTDMTPPAYLQSMTRLLAEPNLRADLIAKGRAHAATFSWRRCAQETVEVYREACRR